jgi:hypothetical protein
MGMPQYGTDTRKDLENTGLVYDQAMDTSASKELSNNLRGTESAQGLLKPDQGYNQGLASDPMSSAIQEKFQRQYATGARKLQHEEQHQSKAQYFDKLSHATELVQQEMQSNFQKRMEKYQQDQARKRARGAVVGQVLGVVGAVVAGIYSGGTGAAAGYAAGNAAGNAIGGG